MRRRRLTPVPRTSRSPSRQTSYIPARETHPLHETHGSPNAGGKRPHVEGETSARGCTLPCMRSRAWQTQPRRGAALAVAGLSVLLLSSCADQPLPAEPAATESSSTSPLFPGETPHPTTTLTAEQTKGLVSTPWVLLHSTKRSVTIRYLGGDGCTSFRGVRIEETSARVELWTTAHVDSGGRAPPTCSRV